jgi:fructosamine-3-kinase
MFEKEALGLETLRAVSEGPRVPHVLATGREGSFSFILMEYLEAREKQGDYWECFGAELAGLHRSARNSLSGFSSDNYIGASPQKNSFMPSWTDFFRVNRLEYQLKLARDRGLADSKTSKVVSSVLNRLDSLLIEPDGGDASLLHGDLWGGNFIEGPEGKACLIDPAVYYGHREADLAMTELFGGFNRAFYQGYNAVWPLDPGYPERRDLYNLYHMLNHLNLFGAGYAGSVYAIASRYA